MVSWLVTGAGGQLGSVLLRQLADADANAHGTVSPTGSHPKRGPIEVLDLCDAAAIRALVDRLRPRLIVHAAAVSTPAAARAAPELAQRVNVEASRVLCECARAVGARLAYISTDMVFDGDHAPYAEDSSPAPCGIYATTKLAAENVVRQFENTIVLRVPLLYGFPSAPRASTFQAQVAALRAGQPQTLFTDEFRTPLWLEDAAAAIRRVCSSAFSGVLHLGGPERLSRMDMGLALARVLGLATPNVRAGSRLDFDSPEPRPRDLSLNSKRFEALFGHAPGRPMVDALPEFLRGDTPEVGT